MGYNLARMYEPRSFDPLGTEPLIDSELIDFNLSYGFSTMLIGRHGVGKTGSVREEVQKKGWRLAYFSGGTIDPWVNFVGLPREFHDEVLNVRYSDLILPKIFAVEEIDVIFLDEYNRAPKPVRNSMMELVQFGTVNGRPLPSLKAVVAAMNPDADESYLDVEPLDQAQIDRFDVHYSVPYSPCPVYMLKKYGEGISDHAIAWWAKLPASMQAQVSPRRLCRALEYYMAGGDIKRVLPKDSLPEVLSQELSSTPHLLKLTDLYAASDKDIQSAFEDENTYARLIRYIVLSERATTRFLPFFSDEQRMSLANKDLVFMKMLSLAPEYPNIKSNVSSILTGGDRAMARKAAVMIQRDGLDDLFPEIADISE